MKKSIGMILLILIILTGCTNAQENLDIETDIPTEETEEITAEARLQELGDYVGTFVDKTLYNTEEPLIGTSSRSSVSWHSIEDRNIEVEPNVYLEDGTVITVSESTVALMLFAGYVESENIFDFEIKESDDIFSVQDRFFIKDGKQLWAQTRADSTDEYTATLRTVTLCNDNSQVDFDYCGLTRDSNIEDVIIALGVPEDISLYYYPDSDRSSLSAIYHSEDGWWTVSATFSYDFSTEEAVLDNIYLSNS